MTQGPRGRKTWGGRRARAGGDRDRAKRGSYCTVPEQGGAAGHFRSSGAQLAWGVGGFGFDYVDAGEYAASLAGGGQKMSWTKIGYLTKLFLGKFARILPIEQTLRRDEVTIR